MNDGSLKKYIGKYRKYYSLCFFVVLSFNLYFIFLLYDRKRIYLFYLDFLLFIAAFMFFLIDYLKFRKIEMEKKKLLQFQDIIYQEIPVFENKEIAEHDIKILQTKLQQQFEANCDLQDYTMKYCHEVKIPLSAGLLINERIADIEVRLAMRENLERINQQLNTMLLGCRLQGSLFDLRVTRVSLQECVRASIKNNQFFLIQKHFSMDVAFGEQEIYVYTDKSWLVYILDQLLNNAIKYRKEQPYIKIWVQEKRAGNNSNQPAFISPAQEIEQKRLSETETIRQLFIEDHGVGIQESDIRRVFEKGFTGSNYHNGKYKSTGMGLYLVAKIAERLKHEINVKSEYGNYTRFCITFRDNRTYFFMDR